MFAGDCHNSGTAPESIRKESDRPARLCVFKRNRDRRRRDELFSETYGQFNVGRNGQALRDRKPKKLYGAERSHQSDVQLRLLYADPRLTGYIVSRQKLSIDRERRNDVGGIIGQRLGKNRP